MNNSNEVQIKDTFIHNQQEWLEALKPQLVVEKVHNIILVLSLTGIN